MGSCHFFTYKVIFFDEDEGELKEEKGVVIGESTFKVMEIISNFYLEKFLDSVSVQYFDTAVNSIITEEEFPNTVQSAFIENKRNNIVKKSVF